MRTAADRLRGLVLGAAVAFAVAAPVDAAAKAPPPPSGLFGGPFTLVDHAGIERTEASFRGRFLLINFGYTYCPDICPTALTTMAAALDMLGPAADEVQPLFVTVDPARDTVEQLNGYVAAFHPRLIGLTGSEAQVRRAAKAYRVHRSKVLVDGEAADDYLVNHSSLTYLMDPAGGFVTLFPHGTEPRFMADALRRHLAAKPAPKTARRAKRAD